MHVKKNATATGATENRVSVRVECCHETPSAGGHQPRRGCISVIKVNCYVEGVAQPCTRGQILKNWKSVDGDTIGAKVDGLDAERLANALDIWMVNPFCLVGNLFEVERETDIEC